MTAQIPTYNAVQNADSAATASNLVLRDNNGDCAVRRITAARVTNSGGQYLASTSKTATATATTDNRIILCDATAGAITINLPAVSGASGQLLTVKKTDSSGNAATLDGSGSETIDGATTKTLSAQWDKLTVFCDGTQWLIV